MLMLVLVVTMLQDMVGAQAADLITLYTAPVRSFWAGLPSDYQVPGVTCRVTAVWWIPQS